MTSTEKSGTGDDKVFSMKLLVDTKSNRVLYAEAGKDVVDFLFSLLTLPLGRADRLLHAVHGSVGCIGNLHASVERLENKYICHVNAKDALLTPAAVCESGKLLQLLEAVAPKSTQVFRCNSNLSSYPSCRNYVTMIVEYTVMDDLNVVHMPTISGITHLNTFGITDIRTLQEKTVQIGYAEGLEMLKASLQSKTVLIDVFLAKKRKVEAFE